MRIVLAAVAREAPNAQGKAERLKAATVRHLEDMMATCHPLVLLERSRKNHPTPSVPSDSFGRNTVWIFTCAISAMSSYLSAILIHPGILSSFESQRLAEECHVQHFTGDGDFLDLLACVVFWPFFAVFSVLRGAWLFLSRFWPHFGF